MGPLPVISWVYVTLPRIPATNEDLGLSSLLNMVHSPGADCYWVGDSSKL